MTDLKIKKGLSTDLYTEPGVINPKLIIENGYWYLCTDTAELFLGVYDKDEKGQEFLTLKQINGTHEGGSTEVDLTGYAKLTDIPDVSKFITNAEVMALIPEVPVKISELENDAGYITAEDVPEADLSNYYNKEEVDSLINGVEHPTVDLTGYATKEDVAEAVRGIEIPDVSEFIKEIPAEYITETELEAKKYLTAHQDISGKADKEHTHTIADITDYEAPNFTGYATEEFVTTKIAEAELADTDVDLTAYYTKSEVEALIPDVSGFIKDIPAEYVTEEELTAKGYLTEHQDLGHLAEKDHVHEGYAAKEHTHDQYLTAHQDISGKADKEHSHSYNDLTDKPVFPALDDYAKKDELFSKDYNELTNKPELFSGNYNDLSNKPELFDGDYDSLTNKPTIPSIEGLATEAFVAAEIKKIEIPEEYNDSEIRELINSKAASDHTHDEYALTEHTHDEYLTEHQSLAEYVKKSELDYNDLANKPTIPSLEGYATKTFVDENYYDKAEVGPFITKVTALETFKTDVTTNYATKQYVTDAIETHEGIAKKTEVEEVKTKLETEVIPVVTVKADEVPFTDSKIVNKTIGGFTGDGTEDIKGWTIAKILAKLLGVADEPGEDPEVPDADNTIVGQIIKETIPMYQLSADGVLKELTYTDVITISAEDDAKVPQTKPTVSGFYKILDTEGNGIEYGYQQVQTKIPDVPYMIALPDIINYQEHVSIEVYDDITNSWKTTTLAMTADAEEIAEICDMEGCLVPEAPDGYTLWVSTKPVYSSTAIYRLIITEEV